MKNIRIRAIGVLVLGAALACAPLMAMADANPAGQAVSPSAQAGLAARVQHSLRMLPYYGIFDNLRYQMQGDHVILSGQVVWPIVKSDAENAVKRIPGIIGVTNNIQVLPLSGFDQQIRFAEYRAIFSRGSLYRYAAGTLPAIHIIVDNGNVTLVGHVDNRGDAILANIAANSVPGVFSVKNELHYGPRVG